MTTTPPLTLSRIRSLDGLRGLAALTVVLGHARLVVLQNTDSDLVRFAPIRIPLDFIATMGGHAVWLFFILSGFVLSRMFLENKVTDYGRYILGRLARLYLPVWGALMLVLVCMLAVPRNVAGLGSWVSGHPTQATASDFVKDMFLMLGTSGNLSPLWSLQWEVLFSLLLIVYVTLLKRIPALLGFLAFLGAAFMGAFLGNTILIYMPMFGLGVCIALSWDRLLSLSEKFSARSATTRFRDGAMGFGLLGAIVGLQYLPRALDGFGLPSNLVGALDLTFSLIALALLLVVAALHRPSRWFLELRIMQWLGLVSFSLYLTHEPIILLFAYLSQANLLWVLVGLALTLPTAHAFYRYVEKPAHLFSRRFR